MKRVREANPDSASDFQGKRVVVTGASAGVGRATALAFARRGATVALLARDLSGLKSAQAEIEAGGGRALAFPVDVADAEAVFAAAQACENQLGAIDVWINNAMVTVFSPVAELAPEEILRVTQVTYLGSVHGTLAALRLMRPRNQGVIIQVGSALAYRGIPLQSAYCAAKHAVRAFNDTVRTELLNERSRIRLTGVQLPAINTPQFEWARNHLVEAPRPVAPIYTAGVAAEAIIEAARRHGREYWLGGSTVMTVLGDMLSRTGMDSFLAAKAVSGQKRDQLDNPQRHNNLFESVPGLHRTDGAFGREARQDSLLFNADAVTLGALAGISLLAGIAGYRMGRRRSKHAETA